MRFVQIKCLFKEASKRHVYPSVELMQNFFFKCDMIVCVCVCVCVFVFVFCFCFVFVFLLFFFVGGGGCCEYYNFSRFRSFVLQLYHISIT